MSKWIMWEVGGLFENIGTVVDGMRSLARPVAITDKPSAHQLQLCQGQIDFEHINFHYGENIKVINDLSLSIKPGEKVGIVGRSGRANQPWLICCCAFMISMAEPLKLMANQLPILPKIHCAV